MISLASTLNAHLLGIKTASPEETKALVGFLNDSKGMTNKRMAYTVHFRGLKAHLSVKFRILHSLFSCFPQKEVNLLFFQDSFACA